MLEVMDDLLPIKAETHSMNFYLKQALLFFKYK